MHISKENTAIAENPMEIGVSTVTSKGQVTIPKDIRDKLDLKTGDKIIFQVEENQATIRKAPRDKLSTILLRAEPLPEQSLVFQRRLRGEWDQK